MRILAKLSKSIDAISEYLGKLSQYVVLITVFLGFLNVVLRYVGQLTGNKLTNNSIIEMQWYLYTLIFLLGFGYILKNQINVRVDFWFAEQDKKLRAWIDIIGNVLALFPFCVLALWVTWKPVMSSWGLSGSGKWCFADDGGAFWTYFIDVFNFAGRYCGEISADPNGLNRAPIKTMVLVAFTVLLLQAFSEMFKLFAVLRDQEAMFDVIDIDAPTRVE